MMESLVMNARQLMGLHANLAIQVSVWVLVWMLGLWLLRIRAGAFQYAVWLIALATIPLFPLMEGRSPRVVWVADVVSGLRISRIISTRNTESVPARPVESPLADPGKESVSSAGGQQIRVGRPAGISAEAERRSVFDVFSAFSGPDIPTLLGSVWLVGLVVMLSRMTLSCRALRRIRGSAQGISDPRLLSMVEEVRKEIGVRRPVRLKESDGVATPISYGVRRPVILLPSSLIDQMPRSEMRCVLVHELAHIRRLDFVATLFQRTLEALFFYHPLVWLASSRLTLNREHACDDWVVSSGNDRKQYAMSLLGFMQSRDVPEPRFVSALLGRPGKLARRIATITDTRRTVVPSVSRRAITATGMVAVVGLLWIGSFSCVGHKNAVTQPAPEVQTLLDEVKELNWGIATDDEVEVRELHWGITTNAVHERILQLTEDALVHAEKLPTERARKIARMHALATKAGYAYFSMVWAEWASLCEEVLALARELGDRSIATRMTQLRERLGSSDITSTDTMVMVGGASRGLDCDELARDELYDQLYRETPRLLARGEYTEAGQVFRQVRESFVASKCHSGIAVCDAALGLVAHTDHTRPLNLISSGWLCHALRREGESFAYVGRSGWRVEILSVESTDMFWISKRDIVSSMLVNAFRRPGDTWEKDTPSYFDYPHPLRTTGRVVDDSKVVTVPAGTFAGCRKIRIETDQTDQTLTAVPRIVGMNERKCGVQEAWYAPGVGMVKFRTERKDGIEAVVVLKEYDVNGKQQEYLPLSVGNQWTYVWEGADERDYSTRHVLQVHSQDDQDTYYLSHYYCAYRIGEGRLTNRWAVGRYRAVIEAETAHLTERPKQAER